MVRRARNRDTDRQSSTIKQLPYHQPTYQYPALNIASDDEIESIHQASLKLLSETGINVLWDKARAIYKEHGADVKDNDLRVRFPPEMVLEYIKKAPSNFTLHARNPERHLQINRHTLSVSCVASAPNVSNLDKGRVTGNYEDYCNLLRLAQSLNAVHLIGGYPVEPIDLPASTRHLDAVRAMADLTDKPIYSYALGATRIKDGIEIARLSRGIDEDTLLKEPSLFTIVNANSPLVYDIPMLQGAMEMSLKNQVVCYTPFTLSGAMAPITIPGALVQQNAEALAGIIFSQCVNAGSPVVYGSFTSNVDMKSGSPAFGTPEYVKATIMSGQLARKYNIPIRASNANASNAPDEQSIYESQMSIWACVMGQINVMKHGLGWLEGGLCASYEKMILDAEMLQMMYSFMKPPVFNEDELALSAINEVGPGSHYFAAEHTMARYENAFYSPMLSDWRNYESWEEGGSLTAVQRANKIWKQLLNDYVAPEMPPERVAALDEFIAKRKEQGGVIE